MDYKKALRRQILALRDSLSSEERKQASLLLKERICGHQWFAAADTVLGFVSYGSEIDTTAVLQEALDRGKKVYVPKVEGTDMVFYQITSFRELTEGYKGIREPVGDTKCFVYQEDSAAGVLMLMPGTVFDLQRNRMGYGKGFYDRYLSDKKALQQRTIGIGYKCQLVENVPAEAWDIKPCQVICV